MERRRENAAFFLNGGIMKRIWGQVILAAVLLGLSAALFLLHFVLYHDSRFIMDWFLGSIAFLPVSVLFVSIILDRIIASREKAVLLAKLNMVIGAFFSEAGSGLLRSLVKHATVSKDISPALLISNKWTKKDFFDSAEKLKGYFYGFDARDMDLNCIRDFLTSKRPFLLRLLENQNLLEHETFTDLLWAVFHVTEELESRKNLKKLGQGDLAHISGDIQRAYVLLVVEWLGYMSHLKSQYPYLYSLAVRTNPFDKNAKVEIQ
jgi:hypothetical protein